MLDTLVVTLMLTLPAFHAATVVIPPDQRDDPADSVGILCTAGPDSLAGSSAPLESLRFYALPVAVPGWNVPRQVYAKNVERREGLPDTTTLRFPGWTGAHFYATTTNTAGRESCASSTVYKGTTTGVPLPPAPGAPTVYTCVWFNVAGQRIRAPRASGIYFALWFRNGKELRPAQRVPFVRGAPLVRVRPP